MLSWWQSGQCPTPRTHAPDVSQSGTPAWLKWESGILVWRSHPTTHKNLKHCMIWKSNCVIRVRYTFGLRTQRDSNWRPFKAQAISSKLPPPLEDTLLCPESLALLVIKSDYLKELDYHWPICAPSFGKRPPLHLFVRLWLPCWYSGELWKQNVTLILNETASFWGSG